MEKVITGEWDGEPISRDKTAQEKLEAELWAKWRNYKSNKDLWIENQERLLEELNN